MRLATNLLAAALLASALPACAGHRAAAPAPTPLAPRVPPLDRDERWREDVHALADGLARLHKNAFAHVTRAVFAREVAATEAQIPALTDAQVQWRLRRLAALLRDGHTHIQGLPQYPTRVPVSFYWADDGLFVEAAMAEHRELIGRRVLAINGVPLAQAADTFAQYLSLENPHGLRIGAWIFLTWPGALRDVGLGADTTVTTLLLADTAGATSTVRLAAVANGAYHPAPTGAPVPLYLSRTREKYWFTYLPESRTVFLQYNSCSDARAFRQLADSLWHLLTARPVRRLVVDLRLNPGGNSMVITPLFTLIRGHPPLQRPGALFGIIGPQTFSSGLMAAIDLKTLIGAILVGEPNSERPNSYGEVRSFKLPNSGIAVSYSTKFFREVPGNPDALYPDVAMPITGAARSAGRDPALEWILAQPLPPAF